MTSYEYSHPSPPVPIPPPWPYAPPSQVRPTRPGVETRQILLTLGAICLVVALTAGTALIWKALGRDGQLTLMAAVTAGLLTGAAALRRLPATAEALAAVGLSGCAIDAAAARTLHLPLVVNMPLHVYITFAAAVITVIAGALQAAAPRLLAAPIGWSGASMVAIVAAEAEASTNTRAFFAIALLVTAASFMMLEPADLFRRFQIAAVTALGVPGALAWTSLIAATRQFAIVNFVLAGAAASVAALLPRTRSEGALIRNAAVGAATFFASIAAGITVGLHHVTTPEAYVLTPAACLLTWGAGLLVRDRQMPSTVLAPGLVIGLLPTLVMALGSDHERQAVLLVVATVIVCVGAELRLAALLLAGGWVLGLLSLRLIGPQLVHLPHWLMWFAAGSVLLTLGATWEARVQGAHKLRRYLRPHIEALR